MSFREYLLLFLGFVALVQGVLLWRASRKFDHYGSIFNNLENEVGEVKKKVAEAVGRMNGLMKNLEGALNADLDGVEEKEFLKSFQDWKTRADEVKSAWRVSSSSGEWMAHKGEKDGFFIDISWEKGEGTTLTFGEYGGAASSQQGFGGLLGAVFTPTAQKLFPGEDSISEAQKFVIENMGPQFVFV